MKAIYFCEAQSNVDRVYSEKNKAEISALVDIEDRAYGSADVGKVDFKDVDFIFSTWGMPVLSTEEVREFFPNLKCVFYSAGTVKYFAEAYMKAGVRIFSAWKANSVPVFQYVLSQILLANKGYYYLSRKCSEDYDSAHDEIENFDGNFDTKVGIIGYGAISSQVVNVLLENGIEVMVYSTTMTEEKAKELGVKKSSIKEIFANCRVISNHLANRPDTVGMIGAEYLNMLKPYSTFINTGRGAQVDEAALIKVLESDDTITAVLDVTDPEPPEKDSKFYSLPNCVLTPHIAGSSGHEVHRMAKYMTDECKRYLGSEEPKFEVSEKMLETMA